MFRGGVARQFFLFQDIINIHKILDIHKGCALRPPSIPVFMSLTTAYHLLHKKQYNITENVNDPLGPLMILKIQAQLIYKASKTNPTLSRSATCDSSHLNHSICLDELRKQAYELIFAASRRNTWWICLCLSQLESKSSIFHLILKMIFASQSMT